MPGWLGAIRAYLVATAALNLLWETTQLPLYEIGRTGTMAEKALAVLHCTMGDVLIALASIAAGLLIAGEPAWPGKSFVRVAVIALAIGLGYTVFSEYRNVEVLHSWD